MPMKAFLLRFHRWISLTFALPLLGIIVTGLILSFEPATESGRPSVPVDEARLVQMIRANDPSGTANSLAIRGRDDTLVIGQRGGQVAVDLASGAVKTAPPSTLSALYRWARPFHEHLVYDLGWLVTASTIAMLVISVLGVLMGLPRLRNTLGGWHSTGAYVLLPLVILSPLTGLMLAFGLGNGGAPPAQSGRVSLPEVVSMVARQHDLADLQSIRSRGPRMMVRVVEGTRPTTYAVSKAGLEPISVNWSRSVHEGTWNTLWGPLANAAVSVLFLGLIATGTTIWLRRTLKQRRIRAEKRSIASVAG